ncbi:hypothetical protein MCOR03_000487 [Pyricularia oryzae]|nr:hypothetical protein MCOR26_006928 [Pyricularia oryzae]KAI6306256.1 hypothetical protein MCOR34_008127 [Pyricularia oryzae]KAI6532711.1 hypothetical protein MCOR16_003793 [Pyricularia oryzae]KAI6537559.1 hypothetical protein MCOR05_005307 [Pyricularia oryzae]KAI6568449.1 hypothetical protein MCOR03_000487 [Pyricularia oryzae]
MERRSRSFHRCGALRRYLRFWDFGVAAGKISSGQGVYSVDCYFEETIPKHHQLYWKSEGHRILSSQSNPKEILTTKHDSKRILGHHLASQGWSPSAGLGGQPLDPVPHPRGKDPPPHWCLQTRMYNKHHHCGTNCIMCRPRLISNAGSDGSAIAITAAPASPGEAPLVTMGVVGVDGRIEPQLQLAVRRRSSGSSVTTVLEQQPSPMQQHFYGAGGVDLHQQHQHQQPQRQAWQHYVFHDPIRGSSSAPPAYMMDPRRGSVSVHPTESQINGPVEVDQAEQEQVRQNIAARLAQIGRRDGDSVRVWVKQMRKGARRKR